MKKILLLLAVILLASNNALAQDPDLKDLDTQSRVRNPNTNSIMFRRNAAQYRNLSSEEKQEIEQQREDAKEVYRRQKEEFLRRQAMEEARRQAEEEARRRAEEEERMRAEALKPITLFENKLKIYALVNGELITSSDMQSRINAFILTTGIPYNEQTKTMITNKVLQSAIDEKLKIQEAEKNNIRISQKEIDNSVRQFEKANGMPAGQLKKILQEAKVSMKVWTTQIEADLAWRKLISNKGYNQITVSENEINSALADIKKDMKTHKFLLSEIVIDKKDAKDLDQLVDNLRHDPRFELYAMQFSQNPSSANGGHLGWVAKGKLPKTLENAVMKMKEGEVSDPIAYGKDFYIYKLEKIATPQQNAQATPTRNEIKTFLENKKLEELSNKYIKDLRTRALIEKKV